MKYILVSVGGSGFNIDDLMRRDVSNVELAGWYFTSFATVVTLLDPLPKRFFSLTSQMLEIRYDVG